MNLQTFHLQPPFKAYEHYMTDSNGIICLIKISSDYSARTIYSIANKLNDMHPVSIKDCHLLSSRVIVNGANFVASLESYLCARGYDYMEASAMNREFLKQVADKISI